MQEALQQDRKPAELLQGTPTPPKKTPTVGYIITTTHVR